MISSLSDSESDENGEYLTPTQNQEPKPRLETNKEKDGSWTETDSEYDIEDDLDNYGAVSGLEVPTSMINIDLDKFTEKIGISSEDFKRVLKSSGGPFEHGKINPPADTKVNIPIPTSGETNKSAIGGLNVDSISIISKEESGINEKGEKKKKPKKQTYWKPDEDLKLKDLYDIHGNNWVEIQQHFPEKSKEQIHNHIRHLKKSGKLDLIGTKSYDEIKKKKGKNAGKNAAIAKESADKESQSNMSKEDIPSELGNSLQNNGFDL